MKRIAILIIALGFGVLQSEAQSRGGLKGGANFTNLYVEEVDDENMKIGFNVGAYYFNQVAGPVSFQPEFLFSQKGAEIHYDGSLLSGSGKYRYNLNYLEVPILLGLNFDNINVHVGPYLGLLIGVNIKDVDDDGNINDIESLDRDDFNTLDAGISGGMAFNLEKTVLGIRYNYGFKEIGKSGTFAEQATSNSKNSALQLYLGFDF